MPTAAIALAPSKLTCQVLTRAEQLAEWQGPWFDLLSRSASNELTLSPIWLRAWWDLYGEGRGRELRVALFLEGQRLVGLAPLLARRVNHWRCLPFRRLELLGSDHDQPDAICSEYLNLIIEGGKERLVVDAFTSELEAGRLGPWDELWFPVMDGSGPVPQLLLNAFERDGFQTTQLPYHSAPYLSLPATWQDYLAGLDKKKRYGIQRSLRDFEEWSGGDYRFHRASTHAELAEGQRVLESLHGSRWSQDGSGGRFLWPRFRAFHQRLMADLLDQGTLELHWLEARNEPVAAIYCFVWNNKVTYYQCGRRVDLPRKVRPGTVLLCHVIRSAIEAGHREFDFLPEPSQYKLDFGSLLRPLVQIRVAKPSLREKARETVERGLALLRRVRKRWVSGNRKAIKAPVHSVNEC